MRHARSCAPSVADEAAALERGAPLGGRLGRAWEADALDQLRTVVERVAQAPARSTNA